MSSISEAGWNEPRLLAEPRAGVREGCSGWRFWLPVALISFAMLSSIHQIPYALNASGEKLRDHDEAAEVQDRSAAKQAGFLLLGIVGAALCLAPTARRGPIYLPLAAATGLLFVYAVASCVWSDSAATTIRRTIVLGTILAGAMGAMRHWQPLDLCRAVVFLSMAFACFGILVELRYGTFLRGHDYRFSGTLHPNRQALNCALLALASLALYAADRRLTWGVLMCVGIAFLLLTRSRGGAASGLAAIGVFWWLGASVQRRLVVLFSGGVILSLLLMYLAFAPDSGPDWKAIGTMGRTAQSADPSTLTGRIPIWQQVYADARYQPWLGYGYGAFWSADRVSGYSTIHYDWAFSNAHSLYLETMANLGLIGLGLGLLVAVVALWRILALLNARRDPALQFVAAVIALSAVNGLVEAICISHGYVLTVMLFGLAGVAFYESPAAEGDE